MSGYLFSSDFINSKFYYGFVLKVNDNDTVDVALYHEIEMYLPGKRYYAGQLVKLPDEKIYKVLEAVVLDANNKTFLEHPELFEEVTPVYYRANLSNYDREVSDIIYGCKILLKYKEEDVVVNNTIVGGSKYLAVGSPVILCKLAGSDDFAVVAFGKISETTSGLTNGIGFMQDNEEGRHIVLSFFPEVDYQYFTLTSFSDFVDLNFVKIDFITVYNNTKGKFCVENSDYAINRDSKKIMFFNTSDIDIGDYLTFTIFYNGGHRYPTVFDMNGSFFDVISYDKPFYSSMSDAWHSYLNNFGIKNIQGEQYTVSSYFNSNYSNNYSNFFSSAINLAERNADLCSLDKTQHGKYNFILSEPSPYNPLDNFSVNEIVLGSVCFTMIDSVDSSKYACKAVLFNSGILTVFWVKIDNNYPVNGIFDYHGGNNGLPVFSGFWVLSSYLSGFETFNYIGNAAVNAEYVGENCTSFSFLFELFKIYPTLTNGDITIGASFQNISSVAGYSFFGYAFINLTNNEFTYPYQKKIDNIYSFYGLYMREFYDTLEDGTGLRGDSGSWSLFRFCRNELPWNPDGTSVSDSNIVEYSRGLCKFPFRLQKCVYSVKVNSETDVITIPDYYTDTPTSGEILINWYNKTFSYDSAQVAEHKADFTRSWNTFTLSKTIPQGTYIFSYYLLFFLNEFVDIFSCYQETYNSKYYLIENAQAIVKSTSLSQQGIFAMIYFAKTFNQIYTNNRYLLDIISKNNILSQYAYGLNNGNIYNLTDNFKNFINSDFNKIADVRELDTSLITNFKY